MNSFDQTQLRVARAMTWRYLIALLLVASLSTAAWISLRLVISKQQSTAALVNVSGRQRMLSQQSALYANLLLHAPKETRPRIRSELEKTIELMALSHRGLTQGSIELALPAGMSPAVHAMYYDGPEALDRQVTSFLGAVSELLTQKDEALDPQLVEYITQTATTSLVSSLNRMVYQYQIEGEAAVAGLKKAERAFWLITLLLLALEAALIFHPFVRHLKAVIGRLQEVGAELQRHKEGLEELVIERTADLEIRRGELALSERRYRTLVENSPFCIHEIDLDGRLQSMNRAGLDARGMKTEKNIRGIPFLAGVGTDDRKRVEKLMREAFAGTAIHYEFRDAEDPPRHFKSCFIPIRDEFGKVAKLMGLSENITERRQIEDRIRQQKQLADDIIDSLPGIFYMLDASGRFLRVNPPFNAVSGYSREELASMTALDLFQGEEQALIAEKMTEAFITGDAWAEAELLCKDGRKIPYAFSGHRIVIDSAPCLVGLGSDISERKRIEEALKITASVFETSQEAILISDSENNILDVNSAFCRITGFKREEVLGCNPHILSSGRHDEDFYRQMWRSLTEQKSWRGEIWNRRKSGEIYAELLSISVISDPAGKAQRYVGVFSDISHLKEHEAELIRVAHYDALTGIPNRVLLADRLKQAFAQTRRDKNMLALCYLDLDGFKPINDTLGHEVGDGVLVEVARRIENSIRGGDTVARLGGDEFVVALLGLEKGDECLATLDRLLSSISMPIQVDGHVLNVSASVGVSIYPLDDEDPDTLLRHADQAMYLAKQSGKNRFHIYDPTLDLRARNQNEILKSVRLGFELGQFELYYQPKIELATRRLVGAEALIRWHHPRRGLLFPDEFLRPVENSELDIEIGDWVISEALGQLERWQKAGLDIEVSVNISAHHLESEGFAEKLGRQLASHPGILPGRLQIEVLETAALNDIAIVRGVIESCRKLGVGFALDDFGTGYSSLAYLGSLPVDALKIDQSFVRDMLEDGGDRAIVQGIIAMAQAFGRGTVAEGIESEAHYGALLEMGCEVGQGFGIALPMPAEALVSWRAEAASHDAEGVL